MAAGAAKKNQKTKQTRLKKKNIRITPISPILKKIWENGAPLFYFFFFFLGLCFCDDAPPDGGSSTKGKTEPQRASQWHFIYQFLSLLLFLPPPPSLPLSFLSMMDMHACPTNIGVHSRETLR